MTTKDGEFFTLRMKKATRELHAVSDALVNAKLTFALSNHSVWADGLLVFYEIFCFLESAMQDFKDDNLGRLHIPGMDRTEAFEKDLEYYLGVDWKKTYVIRDSVARYLSHLKGLLKDEPDLLMAYVYHLYMGLFSGGQILRKKQNLEKRFFFKKDANAGEAVTDFGDYQISDLKRKLREEMNSVAAELDERKKQELIEESKMVFKFNNSIIRSVKGTNRVIFMKFFHFTLFISAILAVLYYSIYKN